MILQQKTKLFLFSKVVVLLSKNPCILIRNPSSVSYLCDVSQWLLILDQHLSKLQALFWIDPHHIPEQEDPVWGVAHLEIIKKKNHSKQHQVQMHEIYIASSYRAIA